MLVVDLIQNLKFFPGEQLNLLLAVDLFPFFHQLDSFDGVLFSCCDMTIKRDVAESSLA